MVGVLIGMIGIIVIFQMLDVSEKRKRTTGAGANLSLQASLNSTSGDIGLDSSGTVMFSHAGERARW